jgi:hypothetical protein
MTPEPSSSSVVDAAERLLSDSAKKPRMDARNVQTIGICLSKNPTMEIRKITTNITFIKDSLQGPPH